MFSLFCRPFDAKNPFLAPILVNRELHRAGNRSCMHIELDITGSKIKYVNEILVQLCEYKYIILCFFIIFQAAFTVKAGQAFLS